MFLKTAQVLLASAALSQAVAVTLKPLNDPLDLPSLVEKRDEVKLKPLDDPADLIEGLPRRRAAQGNEAFDPASSHSFFWGEKVANDVYLANFTMEAPDDNEMLMPIEKFADRLKSIKCDNSTIVIEFASDQCFDYASSVWEWVNKDQNNTMTLVTKAGQCDPDEDRDPFSVTNIKFEKAGLKAVLAAKRLTWQEAAHDYSFVTTEHPNAVKQKQQKRFSLNPLDWFDDTKKKAEEAAKKAAEKAKELAEEAARKTEEAAKKAAEEAKKKAEELKKEAEKLASPEIKESKDLPMVFKYDKNLFEYGKDKYGMNVKAGARVQTSGDLKINVDIKVEKFQLKRAKMSVSPKKFETSLLVAVTAEGKLSKEIKYELPGVEIPVTPIRLPKFLQLGPIVKGSIFFGSATLEGTATASIGGKAVFDDKAIISIDLLDKNGNSAKGWTPKFEKIAPQFSATLEGGIRAGMSLSIGLEASIIDKIGVEAQIEADAPFIEATLKAEKNTLGVCGGKKTMGITFGAAAGVNLHLEAGMVNKSPMFSHTVFEERKELPWNQCVAFGAENAQTSGTILTAIGKTSTATGTPKATGTSKPAVTSTGKTQATGSSKTEATASKSQATGSTAPKSTVSGNPSSASNTVPKSTVSGSGSVTKSSAPSSSLKTNPSSVSSSAKSGNAQVTTNAAASIPVSSTKVTSSIVPTTLATSAAHMY